MHHFPEEQRFDLPILVKRTSLQCKCNVFIRKNIVLKKKTCARVKFFFFSTKISGKCNVTGAIFSANFHKK
jgi:hypothetical protein